MTLDAEHWSFKSDTSSDLTNPLHVTLPTGIISCSSPSPTRCDTDLILYLLTYLPFFIKLSTSTTKFFKKKFNNLINFCLKPIHSSRAGLRLPPYGLSPSPTRRTFQTRRSMSPIAMRPSSLGPVKRKFELDDNYSNSYSPPPFKKIFTERYNAHLSYFLTVGTELTFHLFI